MGFTQATKHSKSVKRRSARTVFVPKPYQKESIRHGVSRPEAGFFLAPGLGKTSIILFIFKILRGLGLVDTLLVLAKKNIVYEVWPREIKKWEGLEELVPVIVHGGPRARTDALYNKSANVFLMNYEGLPWFKKQKRWFKGRKVMLAVDESSKLRNTGTVRYRALMKVNARFVRRYIATGSPTPKSMMNLFGQIKVLDLGTALGQYITHYRNQFFVPTGWGGHDWKLQPGGEKRIFKKIRHMVIRYGEDQLDLPPVTFIDKWVTLPKKARALYDELEEEFIVQWKNHEIVAANAAVVSGKLRQIANGGIFVDQRGEYLEDEQVGKRTARKWIQLHDAKNEALVELLDELQGEPALIGYEYKHDRERLARYYRKEKLRDYAEGPFIDGSTKREQVRQYVADWEEGELVTMHGNIQSVAHGLNLQGKGGIVVYYAMTWDFENYDQFFRRVWRQGQKKRVLVYRILARNTVDELMVDSISIKGKGQDRLFKAMEKRYGFR